MRMRVYTLTLKSGITLNVLFNSTQVELFKNTAPCKRARALSFLVVRVIFPIDNGSYLIMDAFLALSSVKVRTR